MKLRRNRIYELKDVFLLFGKNAPSFWHPLGSSNDCVAASEAMRFSVRSSGYALFLFERKHRVYQKQEGNAPMKRWYIMLLTLSLTLLFCGCGSPEIYHAVSEKIYLYGEELPGPRESIDSDKCYISVKGDQIEFHYFYQTCTGTYQNGRVLWDIEPEVLADSTHAYTELSPLSADSGYDGYTMSVYCDCAFESGVATIELRFRFLK